MRPVWLLRWKFGYCRLFRSPAAVMARASPKYHPAPTFFMSFRGPTCKRHSILKHSMFALSPLHHFAMIYLRKPLPFHDHASVRHNDEPARHLSDSPHPSLSICQDTSTQLTWEARDMWGRARRCVDIGRRVRARKNLTFGATYEGRNEPCSNRQRQKIRRSIEWVDAQKRLHPR